MLVSCTHMVELQRWSVPQGRAWMGRRRWVVLVLALSLVGALGPRSVRAGLRSPAPAAVASVRWIFHGVTVRPPHGTAGKGKQNQKLYNQYGVQTTKNQRTSLGFDDHTLLHVNQSTS